jgi:hypothetical protein
VTKHMRSYVYAQSCARHCVLECFGDTLYWAPIPFDNEALPHSTPAPQVS